MRTQALGASDLVSSRLGYGCMRIAGTWNPAEVTAERAAAAEAAVLAAYEAGYTLFDNADIYAHGACEELFGRALRRAPGMRDRIVVATKCGIWFPGEPNPDSPHRYDFSKEHIVAACEGSLRRMGIETIDLYHLHRPDLLMNPPEVGEAFEALRKAGKVRWFGVSNFSPSFVAALQSGLDAPLVVNQVEIHLGRLDCLADGTLDQCLERGITPLSWSPLGGGFLGAGGTVGEKDPRREARIRLLETMDAVAERLGASRATLALAWLLKHPSGIVPIVGSAHPERIREATKADELELGREDWYRLLVAARGEPLP